MGNKYVYNSHIAPVSCNIRDERGNTLSTKTFQPERIDGTTGRVISTGYTPLTDEEYSQLCESSRTFTHYKDKLKLLSVRDDVPPEAKQPHEALADARRETRDAKAKAAALEEELARVNAELLDANDRVARLMVASTTLVTAIGSAKKLDEAAKAAQEFTAKSAEVAKAVKKDRE